MNEKDWNKINSDWNKIGQDMCHAVTSFAKKYPMIEHEVPHDQAS
ncbi:hypothetical protein [Lactiplantibacillus plantarum]|nr:hypothetical protein [Lactiplantibacillus plantarum]ARW13415.1 hypothetical protein S100434_01266 [Lactiplantibacillus plantarum subsp. plantarum]QHM23518.1 hypothetical protein C7M31_03033 [Lactiplantibacillus plantarum]QHM23544.1 hypothetical protein C7M32_00023 [Lactiplantibacillus plantarum]QHM29432.1 hypothetical protein C7M33_03033 [Lactiplantibacillus plantarum]